MDKGLWSIVEGSGGGEDVISYKVGQRKNGQRREVSRTWYW